MDIELTQGKIALIDDEDYELVSAFTWCAHKMSNCFYDVGYFLTEEQAIKAYNEAVNSNRH